MVRYHDRRGAAIHGDPCILGIQNALQDNRNVACAAQPIDVVPIHVRRVWLPHRGLRRVPRLNDLTRRGDAGLHVAVVEMVAIVAVAIGQILIVDSDHDALGAQVFDSAGVARCGRFGGVPNRVRPPLHRLRLIEQLLDSRRRANQSLARRRRARYHGFRVGDDQILAPGRRDDDRRVQLHP